MLDPEGVALNEKLEEHLFTGDAWGTVAIDTPDRLVIYAYVNRRPSCVYCIHKGTSAYFAEDLQPLECSIWIDGTDLYGFKAEFLSEALMHSGWPQEVKDIAHEYGISNDKHCEMTTLKDLVYT